MPQPPRNDGWKHTSKQNPAKPPAAQHTPNTSRKPWQPGAPKAKTTAKTTSRWTKFLVAGIIVGLLTSGVVIVAKMIFQPKYPTLVVVAPDVPDSLALPENAAGVTSAKGVEDVAKDAMRLILTAGRDATSERDSWRSKVAPNDKGVVLYFAAHAGADTKGPYLWQPPKGAAVTDDDKLYVTDILQRLSELPKSQSKLLVIDIAQTPANWAFGGAYSDFVRAVKGLDSKIEEVSELTVLLSADEDQVSWIADERRKSAFGFYFVEGIRGAADKPNESLTANKLYTYLKTEVQKWAVANRGANQQPVLLPKASGEARAMNLKLATLPHTAYTAPDKQAVVVTTPDALRDEWKRVERLVGRTPSPDTTDPLKWREYLEWLLRWERLLRVEGADGLQAVPATLPPRVLRLGEELEKRASDAAVCGVVALPAGPALSGGGEEKLPDASFAKLWELMNDLERSAEWSKLVKDADASREAAIRTAVARFVVDKVLADNVSHVSLKTANDVLGTVGGVQPVEAHYVRMLHLHLPGNPVKRTEADVKAWPPADLLKTAITLRRTAEQTAWADGLPYPEQAFRWTFPLVNAADKNRQKGEDLLFDTDPKSWAEATNLFTKAQQDYTTAKDRSQVVAETLARRDRVFARLPYYAKWVAAVREGPKNADPLLGQLEQAASAAHKIDKLIREVTATPTSDDINALKKASDDAAVLDAVANNYDEATKSLSEEAQASNWHAIATAQTVPFRKPRLGLDLGQKGRTVAISLARAAQQPAGTTVPENSADLVKSAARHLRVAAAYLPTLARNTELGEKPVPLAESLAVTIRGLPVETSKATGNANAQDTLRGGANGLAEANRLARQSHPAAPVGGTPTPPEADRRFWRHYFLLAQARRFILDGWCSDKPDEKNTERWYCMSAVKLILDSADTELGRLVPGRANLPPASQDRLNSDLGEARKLKPTELEMIAEPTRVVVPDEPNLRYEYKAAVKQGEQIGFPVAQYNLPDVLAKANPQATGRRLERRLSTEKVGKPVPQVATFTFGADRGKGAVNTLSATLRYRGRLYQADTGVTFVDGANLKTVYTPPTGNAVAALQAKPDAISGAVTILVDVTESMTKDAAGGKGSRALQARLGLQKLVERMMPGTQLTIGRFYGKGQQEYCEVIRKPFVVREAVRQGKELFEDLEKSAAPVDGSYTPVAGAIRTVLDPATGKDFWPTGFTGQKVLIVLTDGADTWNDGKNPGYTVGGKAVKDGNQWQVVVAGLKAAVADRKTFGVGVRMVMFGVNENDDDVKRAKDQFGDLPAIVEKDPDFTEARFHFMPSVKSGDEFATKLAQAVMPRLLYSSTEEKPKVMVASLAGEPEYNPTPELKPGTFILADGVNTLPRVQLDAGERALLRAERNKDDRVVITRPPFALELADSTGREKRPKNTAGGLAITMPALKYTASTPRSNIEAVVTLEELDPALKDGLLKAGNRDYAWFDLTNPDGTPFDSAKGPRVTIHNHLEGATPDGPRVGHELLAPAWDVSIKEWDEPGNNNSRKFRRPRITGYWLNGLPAEKAAQNVTIDAIRKAPADELPLKTFEFATGGVEVRGVTVAERNKQYYLTVWMDYGKPGELVLLRATGWKDGRVGESHTYYDQHHRYTAEFGPFPVEEMNTGLRLWLYSVEDLRKFATDKKRAVTLEGEKETTNQFELSRPLVMIPQQ